MCFLYILRTPSNTLYIGVTEALDATGSEFGPDRMIKSVQASAMNGAAAIITRVIEDLRAFVGTTPQNDDITLIVIRKT